MVTRKWRTLCINLGVPADKISESQQNNTENVHWACFTAMLWWLDGNCRHQGQPPTWQVLLNAMRTSGFPDKAEALEEKLMQDTMNCRIGNLSYYKS